ncbi:MAG TPA: 4Fe-4S dicluster domain-containing protein, partial [Pirellulales bacterium]
RSLHCIRCGACMNTCPVYRRSGGHSYGSTVPGPIGSILAPARDAKAHASLPFACSLCGSCTDVCPVKIDLHHQLLAWRGEIGRRGLLAPGKRVSMKLASFVLRNTRIYEAAGRIARWLVPRLPRFMVHNRFNAWGRQREMPEFPAESFRELYRRRKQQDR